MKPKNLKRLTWAEISRDNFSRNFTNIKKLVGPKVKIMAVVKANAYGHGIVQISKWAEGLGASYLGVVCLGEAEKIRLAGIKLPVLILNYLDPDGLKTALELNLTINVMDKAVLQKLDVLARKMGKKAAIHVKIDSGMHRAGITPDKTIPFISQVENYKNIYLEGIFTHLATADEKNLEYTYQQLSVFENIIKKLQDKNINPPLIHAANSAATLRLKNAHYKMVRPGIILYGLPPSEEFRLPFNPDPVLTLKTIIIQIREIQKGEAVGYGRKFIAGKTTRVGLLPVGYADGFRRAPQNWQYVLVHGKKAPLLGRVSMDQSSIDVTNIPDVKVGDEVVLIGKQGNINLTSQIVGSNIGTINYEVITSISERVERIYI